ncbi:MAG: DUF4276 family protein [Chromatiales bacterium]|jgi:hypothetical protein
MRQLEVLVEEPSAKAALDILLPKIVQGNARFAVRNFGSKYKLLKELSKRLAGYAVQIKRGENLRILVLIDQDSDDCMALKQNLENVALECGLATKSHPDAQGCFVVVNRVVVEELESWFIGDPAALRRAFPKLPPANNKGIFAKPDNQNGKAWESLHRFLKKHGIYKNHYPKIEAAKKISPFIDLGRNRSPSFQQFLVGIGALL